MAITKFSYSSETAITCGIDGLLTSAARASTSIDNTTNLYVDALIQMQIQTTTGSLATSPVVYLYAYGWSYGQGTDFTDNVSGTDAAYTIPTTSNLKLLGAVAYNVGANTTLFCGPFSLALAFGGTVPGKWGVVVSNLTGLSFSGTSGAQVNNTVSYVGLYLQSV